MSDSGLPQLPSSTAKNVLQATELSAREAAQRPTTIEILNLPENVKRESPSRLRGTIAQRQNDNTAQVKTEHGTITVKLPKDNTLKNGDAVEIKINTQSTPPTATIQKPAARPQNTTQPQSPAPDQYDPAQYLKILQAVQNKRSITETQAIVLIPLTKAQYQSVAPLPVLPLPSTVMTAPPALPQVNLNLITPDVLLTTQPPTPVLAPPLTEIVTTPLPQFINALPTPNAEITATINTALQKDITNGASLPFRTVAPLLLKSLPDDLLTLPLTQTSPITTEKAAPSVFEMMPLTDKPLFPASHHHAPFLLPQLMQADEAMPSLPLFAQAGQIEAKLIGVTPEMEFPVFALAQSQTGEQQLLAMIPSRYDTLEQGANFILQPLPDNDGLLRAIPDTLKSLLPSLNTPAPSIMPALSAFMPVAGIFDFPPAWPVMNELVEGLQQISPQSAAQFAARMPNTSAPMQMAGTALFFIAAMRAGDMQSWMGERAIDTLRRAGKSDLLNRFLNETGDRARSESTQQEWRSTTFPLMHENQIHRIILHYRKEQKHSDEAEHKGGGTTRFVLDLSLSNMGKLQCDGLFQKGKDEKSGRLDLILRTEHPFSAHMHQEMRALYSNALTQSGYSGELSFQSNPDLWVKVLSPHAATAQYSKNI